jgi:hypothetical protein
MGALTESKLDEIVNVGCPHCGAGKLRFSAYLDGRLPLLGGEPVGKLTWCYDGEKFVDGVYEIACAACSGAIFSESSCPRCHAADGLARALAAENSYPLPAECPSCQAEEVRYVAMLPATTVYEGKRATAPRTDVDPYDSGFHGFRIDCVDCGTVAEMKERCPLCDAPGPLRQRPG